MSLISCLLRIIIICCCCCFSLSVYLSAVFVGFCFYFCLRFTVLMVSLLNSWNLYFGIDSLFSSRPLTRSPYLHSFPQPPSLPSSSFLPLYLPTSPPSSPLSLILISSILSCSTPAATHTPQHRKSRASGRECPSPHSHPKPPPTPFPLSPKSAELQRGYSGVVSILKYAECAP